MNQDAALLVMLPGAYDTPADLMQHGFDRLAQQAGFAWQAYPTDPNAVVSGALVHQLFEQVVAPARTAGRRRILLGGISIGGLTALTYMDSYPDTVDGVLLIAPYPGNRQIERTIAESGGLLRWTPGELAEVDGELRGWRALQRLAGRQPPAVWLGYGRQDRFAYGQSLMAAGLPETRVCRIEGGHDWPTWRTLWQQLLQAEGVNG